MRSRTLWLAWLVIWGVSVACVDPEDLFVRGTADILVVDGTITNLAEPMFIRLNRSRVDKTLGRSSTFPITKAKVLVIVDSAEVISCHETTDGNYQLPTDFKGQVGHAYQLRFTPSNGSEYVSTHQVMQPVPSVGKVTASFNLNSVLPLVDGNYTGGHDVFIDVNDPDEVRNYYNWDWTLYEQQDWCRSCFQGLYSVDLVKVVNNSYQFTGEPFEDCFYPPVGSSASNQLRNAYFDYRCLTQCWEIIHKQGDINIFSDQYSNGGLITHRLVGHIPFYQNKPCVVHVRQGSLTKDAYEYYNLFQQQTQNTGGLADTPPSAPIGNIRSQSNLKEGVVGYFTASAISIQPYYIDRKDTQGVPPGLFYALNNREPAAELPIPYGPTFLINPNGPPRPPRAVCAPANFRTPNKPAGWPD